MKPTILARWLAGSALLAGCADRVAPVDAAAPHVYRCVEPEPELAPERNCSELRDQADCVYWAWQYAGDASVYAVCVPPFVLASHRAECEQASWCEPLDGGLLQCHCGNELPCGSGQVCVSDSPDATPYCRCTMQ